MVLPFIPVFTEISGVAGLTVTVTNCLGVLWHPDPLLSIWFT